MATVKVWDPLVRLFHWSLVACFAVAWISADEWQDLHELMGYTIAGLVAFRLLWGLVGPRYARFSQFVRSPGSVVRYLTAIRKGQEKRYIGHNPAGGAMVLLLLLSLSLLTLSGWLGTDIFWGEEWVEELHELMGNLVLLLVAAHLGGVFLASMRHRENLPAAMINGRKRAPSGSDHH
ncbi:cytochrome b/b6 domain-containing protein [Marinobacterium sp. AK62]|uniref:Cytochrome b/b6 domain-containing protein n=1 Tax=Marinobacterium alkalitolerans TaxID=1542925 RepID=A0ABS3ZAN1_9GAMM|nr:cytochrome b/b6 domain-containing protein [Marinobacterium alkalitolerans]MBP0048699.1 cytochrome b/b6 domain-containing protein [Marinobacterium alkalitolerans]